MNLLNSLAQLLGVAPQRAGAPGIPPALKRRLQEQAAAKLDPAVVQYRDEHQGMSMPYPAFNASVGDATTQVPYHYPAYSGQGWQPTRMALPLKQLQQRPLEKLTRIPMQ